MSIAAAERRGAERLSASAKSQGTPAGSEPDVLVVGGGIAGLWCGYFLRRAGLRVTVLDRAAVGDPVACSSGNTGFLGAGGVPLAGPGAIRKGLRSLLWPDDRLALAPSLHADRLRWLRQFRQAGSEQQVRRSVTGMLALKRRSWQLVGEFPAAGFTAGGMLHAYRSRAGFCPCLQGLAAVGRVRCADADAGPRHELRGAGAGCRVRHRRRAVQPGRRLLRRPGVQLEAGPGADRPAAWRSCRQATVTGFRTAAGAVTEVRTSTGSIRPREVVIAAGSWIGDAGDAARPEPAGAAGEGVHGHRQDAGQRTRGTRCC